MKRTLETWLAEYSQDHQNAQNRRIHVICVPLIFMTVAGGLHLLPAFIGDILFIAALSWYATLGLKALAIMLAQLLVSVAITVGLVSALGTPVAAESLAAIFILAWIGQFYGHHLEGHHPSFFRDLQYLLIGPLWVWLGH